MGQEKTVGERRIIAERSVVGEKTTGGHGVLARNNVQMFGRGTRTLLFAHGFGCDQNMWRSLTPSFEDEYRVVLFDYVGSGKADRSAYSAERYAGLDGYAQDVIDVCDALGLSDILFVGHSVSSMIGVLASIRRPDLFRRLVLVAPSPRYVNDSPGYVGGFDRADIDELLELMDKNYLGWASLLAPVVMKNPEQPELAEELEGSFCSTDPVTARQFARATFFADNRADLPRVTVPSLLLQCTDDALAPLSVGEYLHRELPQSTLRVMEATGHCPHVSHPGETARLIHEYLGGA